VVATSFLSALDADWERAIAAIGPCTHDPKASREPYEALIRAGISGNNDDAIIYDIGLMGKSSSGYGHPTTGLKEDDVADDIGSSANAR